MNSKLNHVQNWPELAEKAKWSGKEIARMCGVSERTLERHFLKSFGKSPKVWLNEQRQTLAKKLLEEGVPVGEVADRLCYSRLTNFSRAFKKYWGKAPTAFTASPATEERACRVLNANGGF